MKKVNYDSRPAAIAPVGNGSFLFRWDIEEVTSTGEDGEGHVTYDCYEAVVWGPLNSDKITRAVICSEFDEDRQQKLVNEYNAANLGYYDESEAAEKVEAYKTYLTRREWLKARIAEACAEAVK